MSCPFAPGNSCISIVLKCIQRPTTRKQTKKKPNTTRTKPRKHPNWKTSDDDEKKTERKCR